MCIRDSFVDKQQRWQPHPQPAPLPSTLALDANFRSAPGVIAGINYLFELSLIHI